MKIKNKKIVVVLSVLLLAIISVIVICFVSANPKKDAQEELVENFLTEVFTLNKDNRYDIFADSINDFPVGESPSLTDTSEAIKKAQDLYIAKMSDFATEECISSMIANRLPFKLDSLVTTENEVLMFAELSYNEENENTYSFTVRYDQNQFTEESFSGQVKLKLIDNKYYVDSLFIQ